VRRLLPAGLLFLAGILAPAHLARPELTDAQKRQLFLNSREDIRPVPRASATPRPKPTAIPRPSPKRSPTPRPTPVETPGRTPKPTPAEEPEETPEEPPEKSTPKPTPAPRDTERPQAPIVIEKSGKGEDEGYAPPPKKSGWSIFGAGPKYKYLSASVRAAIDNAKVKKGRWKYIIVHNSGTRQGNARAFDIYHRKVRKMPNGLAYHFVIGNGTSSGNGEIEIGSRWTKQINGGHVASDYLNNIAIGICFVGDFNRDIPKKEQIAALEELITYLRKRCGKVKGKDIIVYGHKQINPKPTDCPGDRFPLKWLNKEFPPPPR
jgi:hypothetical protein